MKFFPSATITALLVQDAREDMGDRLARTPGRETRPLGVFKPGKGILKKQ